MTVPLNIWGVSCLLKCSRNHCRSHYRGDVNKLRARVWTKRENRANCMHLGQSLNLNLQFLIHTMGMILPPQKGFWEDYTGCVQRLAQTQLGLNVISI